MILYKNIHSYLGTRQSPINLVSDRAVRNNQMKVSHDFDDIKSGYVKYDRSELRVDYLDGEITFEADNDDDDEWNSHHFAFHCPAEHQIDGVSYDLEMQTYFYHEASVRELALSVLFKLDNSAPNNDFISSLKLDNITSGTQQPISSVPLRKFFDSVFTKDMFTYVGSLTAPPCFESPEWLVVKEPVKINSNQLQDFRDLWPDNPAFAKGRGNNRYIKN